MKKRKREVEELLVLCDFRRGASIYREWEVRGLGYEGVVEETASTIHAQVVAPNIHKVVLNVQNAATFMNLLLKLLKLHPEKSLRH